MPESTEQILHPEKYAANEAPVDVDLPDRPRDAARARAGPCRSRTRSASSRTASGCASAASSQADADAAAAGWGGDRLAVIEVRTARGPSPCKTAWDTTADAAAFETAATTALAKARWTGQVLPGEGGKVRWVARSRTTRPRCRASPACSAWPARPASRPAGWPAYIDSGAEIPSRPSAFASVTWAARARARRAADRSGSVGVDDARVAVEGVERRRELGRVGRDALRLLGGDGVLDDLREARDRADQRGLGRAGQQARRPSAAGASPASAALRRIEAIRAWAYWT